MAADQTPRTPSKHGYKHDRSHDHDHEHGHEHSFKHRSETAQKKATELMREQVENDRVLSRKHAHKKQDDDNDDKPKNKERKSAKDSHSEHLPDLKLVDGDDRKSQKKAHLAQGKSLEDLMQSGCIKDKRDRSAREEERLEAGKEPKERNGLSIKVALEDRSADKGKRHEKPDFIVKKNGQIEALSNVEKLHKDKVVIEVEREEGDLKPTKKQQERVNELVSYLNNRLNGEAKKEAATKLDDEQGLVSDHIRKKVTQSEPAQERFDEPTRRQIGQMERFNGAGHGRMSRRDADDYFPERTVPRQRQESFQAEDLKDTVAAMFNADKKQVYDEVRQRPDQSYAVGRYGLTQKHFANWLNDQIETLGSPPDMSKLPELMAKLAKEGKIPPQFAEQFKDKSFCDGFTQYLEKLNGKNGTVSGADTLKFLPKELQESVATDLCTKFVAQSGGDAGKAALAWELGKNPGELSAQDLADKQNNQYMDAARRLNSITQARQIAGDNDKIEWNGQPGSLAMEIARDAQSVAQRMSSTGYCFRGVKAALRENGINLSGGAAYMAREQLERDSRFREVSVQNLQPGDILVHPAGYANDGKPHRYGHIAVYLGNNREASDHVGRLIVSPRVKVFRMS